MLKQQRNSAWQLAARGAWEARLSILLQSLRRYFALIHTALLIGRVQWKAAACNGNLYCATETHTSCNGKPQRATESGPSPKEVSLLAVKEPGNVIEFHHYD